MLIIIINTPARDKYSPGVPVGPLSIMKKLKAYDDVEVEFYNIDAARPSYHEVLQYIIKKQPDILGISAVTSTTYEYSKKISLDIRDNLPGSVIVLGGNLASAGETILRKTGVHICVLGEGEVTLPKIVNNIKLGVDLTDYHNIPGILFIDNNNKIVNTGYEKQLLKNQLYNFDWDDLYPYLDKYIIPAFITQSNGEIVSNLNWNTVDSRSFERARLSKMHTSFICSKGCVARCTFCHRFTKGIRYIPVDVLGKRIDLLVNKYNVGFISIGDENFGTDKKWLKEFCSLIKKYDVLWRVSGMRTSSITAVDIDMMKDAGCVSIIYGVESFSDSILKVMEKKITARQNINAIQWTYHSGLYTVIQLVIGMPGETSTTISETIDACSEVYEKCPESNPQLISINYVQALPGTPLYQYGRHLGLIDDALDGEDRYLLSISDVNASSVLDAVNFTDAPTLIWLTWGYLIRISTTYKYLKKHGVKHFKSVVNKKGVITVYDKYPVLLFRLRKLLIIYVLYKAIMIKGNQYGIDILLEYLKHIVRFNKPHKMINSGQYVSLRKTANNLGNVKSDSPPMIPIRKGR